MRHIFLTLMTAAAILAPSGCERPNSPPGPGASGEANARREELVGGWSAGTVDEETRRAAEFAVEALARRDPSAKLKAIREVQTQVVAGVNYRLTLELHDGTLWNAVIYRDLQGNHSVTELEPVPD